MQGASGLAGLPVTKMTYGQLDQWITSLSERLRQEQFDVIVGVLRGGAPLALMASHCTGVPVAFLLYDRANREVTWGSSTPISCPGSKVLLCEDIAGRGFTLLDCVKFLKARRLRPRVLVAAYDAESRVRPDYGIDVTGYMASFPWERHGHTQKFRADWQTSQAGRIHPVAEDHEYWNFAVDLDGVLLRDVAPERYANDLAAALAERDRLPFLGLPKILSLDRIAAIVTGRPECDRARTEHWLAQYGFDEIPLIMRAPDQSSSEPAAMAQHKARAAMELRCTHFVESDLLQAALIAELAPLLMWSDGTHDVAPESSSA